MVFRPQACASATNTLACWARNLMRSTSNLFSSCASCSTEWPPAICETPSAIVFLSSGVTHRECRAPSSGLPTDPSDGPEHAPAAGIEKKKPPGHLLLVRPYVVFAGVSDRVRRVLDFFCWTCQEVSCFRCLV